MTDANASDGAGVDSPYITAMENFAGFAHPELFDRTQQIAPAQLAALAAEWGRLAAELDTALGDATGRVRRAVADGTWQGEAADAALAASEAYATAGAGLVRRLDEMARRLHAVTEVAESVRATVPPPPELLSLDSLTRLIDGRQVFDLDQREAEARQQAIQVLEQVYLPGYTAAGTGVPVIAGPATFEPPAPARPAPTHTTPEPAQPAPAEPEPQPQAEPPEPPPVRSGQPGVVPGTTPIPLGQGGVIMPKNSGQEPTR